MGTEDQDLILAINRLTQMLDAVSDSVFGRGSSGGSKGKTGGTGGKKAESASDKAFREKMEKAEKALGIFSKETDKATDAQKDLTKEQVKAKWAQERTTEAFKDFGMSLTEADANVKTMFSGLGRTLTGTGTTFGRVVGGFATGVGYALGGLQEFAKAAGDMGAFADLDKFSVGSVTSIKLMSGLGGAFMKVIEDSQGGFKAFGANSQEAAENLSNLSRGLKYGSSYLNSTMRTALGKDLVKSVDRASNAAAAMGMSDEERAKLSGAIARDAAYGAKDEQDAQQRYVKQIENTLVSTRSLSNTFGTSTRELQAAMQKFRDTTAGRFAAATGNKGAVKLAPSVEAFGVTSDAELGSRIAKALSEGDAGAARGALAQAGGNASQFRALDLLEQATRGTQGGNDTDAFNKNVKAMLPAMEALGMEGDRLAVNNAELAAPLAKLLDTANKIKTGGKDEGKEAPGTSEMNNIKSMNSLTAALESLRNTIIGLTAGIATLVGSFGALAVFGAAGGLMSGGMGKVGDMLGGLLGKKTTGPAAGSLSGWKAGPTASAGGGGIMDKLSGAAGKGMEGFGEMLGKLGDNKVVKGAGTLALLGAALALTAVGLKTFNDVQWTSLVKGTIALGGLIGMARLVGEATTGIIKGAAAIAILGAAVLISAVGFKTFNDVNWDSLAKGAIAIAALAATTQLLGKMSANIAIGAGAIALLGASMWVAGKGFQSFNKVNWSSMAKGAVALGVLAGAIFGLGAVIMSGAGAVLFGAGLIGMAALGVTAAGLGLALGVASVGMKPFAESLKTIGSISGSNLILIGAGLGAVALGMAAFTAAAIAASAGGLVSGLLGLFGPKSPIERMLQLVPYAEKISMIGEGMSKFGSSIGLINDNLKSLDLVALENFKNALVEISNIDLPNLNGLSIPQISTSGMTGTPQQGTGLADALSGNAAVTPEVISQVMAYLSSIENDLAAIRGNTKQSGYDSPVRLS